MLDLLARLLPRIPDNRIVAFVIPLVTPPIAAAAGLVTTWLAEHVPGVHVTAGQATAFGVTVTTGLLVQALSGARDWMKGHHIQLAQSTGTVDPDVDTATDDELPSDADEAVGGPPEPVEITDEDNAGPEPAEPRDGPPVQPSQAEIPGAEPTP